MINELDLLWLPNFIALGIYFIFETKLSWNKGVDTCFNVECVLLGRNFDFFGGYWVVTARYLVVTACYCSLLGGYCFQLVITACYYLLLLVLTFSMNVSCLFCLRLWIYHRCRWYIGKNHTDVTHKTEITSEKVFISFQCHNF